MTLYLPPWWVVILKHVKSNLYQEVTFGTMEKWSFKTGDLLKEVLFHMKFSMTGQEKGVLLIRVTASVLKMKIWIYWSESNSEINSWIFFLYSSLKKKLKNLLLQTVLLVLGKRTGAHHKDCCLIEMSAWAGLTVHCTMPW